MLSWRMLGVIAGSLALSAVGLPGQEPATEILEADSPEWVAARFLQAKEFPELGRYLMGDMLRYRNEPHPGVAFSDPSVTIKRRVFFYTPERMGVAASISMTAGGPEGDMYVFLRKDAGIWKIEGFRRAYVPPAAAQAAALTIWNRKATDAQKWEARVMESFGKSDAQLKKRYEDAPAKFEKMAQLLESLPVGLVVNGSRRGSGVDAKTWQAIHDLDIYYAERLESGILDICLARVGEVAIGFLRVPRNVNPPMPNAEKLILLDAMDERWFFYRKI